MSKIQKLKALKPFDFRGKTLEVGEEFQPDNEEQGQLLQTIGFAKKKSYFNRSIKPSNAAVMTTAEV